MRSGVEMGGSGRGRGQISHLHSSPYTHHRKGFWGSVRVLIECSCATVRMQNIFCVFVLVVARVKVSLNGFLACARGIFNPLPHWLRATGLRAVQYKHSEIWCKRVLLNQWIIGGIDSSQQMYSKLYLNCVATSCITFLFNPPQSRRLISWSLRCCVQSICIASYCISTSDEGCSRCIVNFEGKLSFISIWCGYKDLQDNFFYVWKLVNCKSQYANQCVIFVQLSGYFPNKISL